ncbi:hypothetical protein EU545_04505 [Candidatus Thorarchaeota archaeon]|nr:MAG: hypothetical protein EU545_04505 [Candidatus Thorarchaeota archaeon]
MISVSDSENDAIRIGEVMVLAGGGIELVIGALFLLNFGVFVSFGIPYIDLSMVFLGLGSIIQGLVLVALSLLVLLTRGSIQLDFIRPTRAWQSLLIIGFVMLLLGGHIGAILIVLGAFLQSRLYHPRE